MKVLMIAPAAWSPDGHDNFDAADELLEESDLVVLPELAGSRLPRAEYLERVSGLARRAGAYVVGGSHYDAVEGGSVNRGVVADPAGRVVAEYEKAHPYGVEHRAGVLPGRPSQTFELAGRRVRVLVCADLWYSARLAAPVDAVLVPAFSVTQWDSPDPSRALWQHMSVARAYEFMTYVAVSDWQHGASYHGAPCAGVTGFADPYPARPAEYYARGAGVRVMDFERLDALRADRAGRGFVS
ncbi:carbon-nitrogen hydrolase family protein [Nonomuraea sp. NPDC050540]|uniref:carbon-nitrogen hydrolase family protein n=1 Tax=Nonomuraea sp. NPDC050540 TaxID=3364367 RepID=UPI0037A9CFEC